jgi:hypothetical protein
MHYSMVQKIIINTWYWTVMIMCSKYYGMCVLCLYIMEWNSLHVNTSYFITEYFYVLTHRSLIEDYLKHVFTD